MNFLRHVFLLVAAAFAAGASDAAVLQCEGCSDWGYEQTAIGAGIGSHLVFDIRNNQLQAFRVRAPSQGGAREAEPIAVDPTLEAQFALLEAALRANGYGNVIVVDTGPGRGPFFPHGFEDANAYDVAYYGNLRNNLGMALADRFRSSSHLLSNVVNGSWGALQIAADIFNQDLTIVVVVHWPDGSSSRFLLDRDTMAEAAFILGGSRDSEGNIVPDAGANDDDQAMRDSYEGNWSFGSGNNLERWLRNAQMYGITITGSSGGILRCGEACAAGVCSITCQRR